MTVKMIMYKMTVGSSLQSFLLLVDDVTTQNGVSSWVRRSAILFGFRDFFVKDITH